MALEFKPYRRLGRMSAVVINAYNAVEVAQIIAGTVKFSEDHSGRVILLKDSGQSPIPWGSFLREDGTVIREYAFWKSDNEPEPNQPANSTPSSIDDLEMPDDNGFIIPGEVQAALRGEFGFTPQELPSAVVHLLTYARAAQAAMTLKNQQIHHLKQEFERIGLDYDEMTGHLQLKPGAQITLVHPPVEPTYTDAGAVYKDGVPQRAPYTDGERDIDQDPGL